MLNFYDDNSLNVELFFTCNEKNFMARQDIKAYNIIPLCQQWRSVLHCRILYLIGLARKAKWLDVLPAASKKRMAMPICFFARILQPLYWVSSPESIRSNAWE